MKRFFVISGALVLALGSCAKDGATAARKNSVSIGRFGVRHNTVPGAPEAVVVQEAVPQAAAEAGKTPSDNSAGAVGREPAPATGPVASDSLPRKGGTHGIRLPNMLGMPEERDLKATNPATGNPGNEGGGVISRPPVEKKD